MQHDLEALNPLSFCKNNQGEKTRPFFKKCEAICVMKKGYVTNKQRHLHHFSTDLLEDLFHLISILPLHSAADKKKYVCFQ